jgi:hypothetical protein
MMEGRLYTACDACTMIRLLNMEPMVELRNCAYCHERQDALRCKQRADPGGMKWKCGYCNMLNRWKKDKEKTCQVVQSQIIDRKVA